MFLQGGPNQEKLQEFRKPQDENNVNGEGLGYLQDVSPLTRKEEC